MEITTFLPLMYLSIGITGAYFTGKLLLNHRQTISKVKRSHEIQKDKKSFEQGIEDIIDNAPAMYSQCMKELAYLQEKGASDEQMKSIRKKAEMLKIAVDNKEIINLAGKPIFRYVGKLISGFGR